MNIPELFASMVFNEELMKERLDAGVFSAWKQCVQSGQPLSAGAAESIAQAMCAWAVEKGATHFCHWFQPMTGVTAEKHEAFVTPDRSGKAVMELSGKELVRGEADASSFPSGGLRATFEARGYTAWDPSSFAFVKDDTLYIPTFFCSYGGEVLDKKTPLLRSISALDRESVRLLRLFGDTKTMHVIPEVGPEQEYFLIDLEDFNRRPDLKLCGRTLFGARPAKGQELDDHYYGSIKHRVAEFMKELDRELWRLGVYAKTEHNEAAPSQHELAPVYCDANKACDHNQIMMELMRKIARRFGLECILHEKPFAGVNGSGKHNNWSLSTDGGENLFKPGHTPRQNARFLTFIAAFIAGADDYQEMLRCCVAYHGNDHRLGGNEAPPSTISINLGDELMAVVESVVEGTDYEGRQGGKLEIGVDSMPEIPLDTTDRNRTSPIAFTGNKFEFRMVGSSQSIAGPNVVLNTMMAEELSRFADRLEKAEDFNEELQALIKETLSAHMRILYNGNCYSDDWKRISAERGLSDLRDTVDSMPAYINEKNLELFGKHGIYTRKEMEARYAIHLADYCKKTAIEAGTLLEMVLRHIAPAVTGFEKDLCGVVEGKEKTGFRAAAERSVLGRVSDVFEETLSVSDALEKALKDASARGEDIEAARFYRDEVVSRTEELGALVSRLEALVGSPYWPYPTYANMLFRE